MIQDVQKVKITNTKGEFIEFGHHFRLLDGLNLSGLQSLVSYSGSNTDGSTYQRTTLNNRDIDVAFYIKRTGFDISWFEQKRRELFRILNPKHNPMKLEFATKSGEEYYLNLNLEASPELPDGFENSNNTWQKCLAQFSCGDPNIYKSNSTRIDIATWVKAFEFPLEIVEGGIEMGYRSPSLIANVFNGGDNDSGMLITFKAMTDLSNPKLINVNTYEELQINFNMQPGDVIEVNTQKRRKSVTLIRNNIRTNIFNTFDLYSTWLQLEPGDNLFRYDVTGDLEFLEVSITFTEKYVGV